MAYFGEGLTGVQAASRHYFEKEPVNLSIPEAALLAGLLQAPSYYSPTKHSDRALQRRNDVIDMMIANASISSSEGENAKAAPLIMMGRDGALKNQF
jgi:membrane peptidoglycan carboxypeptidase